MQRRESCVSVEQMHGEQVVIDGFNLLITLEAALSGGLVLLCRDGCLRDLSSVHGSYRSVQETERAINLIGTTLAELVAFPASKFFATYLQLTASLRMGSASGPGPQVVGETIENDTSAFVVYRWYGAGWPKEPQEVSILRLHRGAGGWRYVPAPDVGSPCFAHALLSAAGNHS